MQNIRSLFGTTNIIFSLMPLTREPTHDFLCEALNPKPTTTQLAKFLGDPEADMLRDRELREQLPKLKTIFKGQKMKVKGEIIEV